MLEMFFAFPIGMEDSEQKIVLFLVFFFVAINCLDYVDKM